MNWNIKEKLRQVLTQNATPHSVATGGAIGMFFGFLPFFGVKTLLSYFTSLILRVNTPAAIIAVTLHDLLLPFLPVILRVEYQLGFWLTSHPHHFAPKIKRGQLNLDFFHDWNKFLKVGMPVLIGSVIVGLLAAGAVYLLVYAFVWRRKARIARHAQQASGE
ncbi:MAG: DUF2062 domain-containing protein [Chthoniobacterales bacterium]